MGQIIVIPSHYRTRNHRGQWSQLAPEIAFKANSCGACLTLCCNRLTKPHAGDYDQNGIAYVLPYGAEPTSNGFTYEPSDASPGCCHPMYSGCCCQCCCCRGKPVSYYVNRSAYPPRQVMVADTTPSKTILAMSRIFLSPTRLPLSSILI